MQPYRRQSSIRSTASKASRMKNQKSSTASVMSLRSTQTKNPIMKEMMIVKKINEIFRERDLKQTNTIREAIFSDGCRVYKGFRKQYEVRLNELVKERIKLKKRKKKTQEKTRLLRQNLVERFHIISIVISKTYRYFKKIYFESDSQRLMKLLEIQTGQKLMRQSSTDSMSSRHSRRHYSIFNAAKQQLATKRRIEEELKAKAEGQESSKTQHRNSVEQIMREPSESVQSQSDNNKSDDIPNPKFETASVTSLSQTRRKVKQQVPSMTQAKKKMTPQQQHKLFIEQLQGFLDSPFQEDVKFAINYIVHLSRDSLDDNVDTLNMVFYDRIYKILLESEDEVNIHQSYEILCNLLDSDFHRKKLADKRYLKKIYQKMEKFADEIINSHSDSPLKLKEKKKSTKEKKAPLGGSFGVDKGPLAEQKAYKFRIRILQRLSWLAAMMAIHLSDFTREFQDTNIIRLMLKLSSSEHFSENIRSNALLALILLTYNKSYMTQMLEMGVIDIVMEICKSRNTDILLKQFGSLALVHLSFKSESIQELLDKGIMELFDCFKFENMEEDKLMVSTETDLKLEEINVIMQTNMTWVFLALCNHGISSKRLLRLGITRDMFMLACNPDYKQLRYLVITSFSILGQNSDQDSREDSQIKHKIQNAALAGYHECFHSHGPEIIDSLLQFAVSDREENQEAAFQSLMNYLFTGQKLEDMKNILKIIELGCITPNELIQSVCVNSLLYLVNLGQIYGPISEEEEVSVSIHLDVPRDEVSCTLDAIMMLTSSDTASIRAKAFQILSMLAFKSASHKSIKNQLTRDIEIPLEHSFASGLNESGIDQALQQTGSYINFITHRLKKQSEQFRLRYQKKGIEERFCGLNCLLQLTLKPTEERMQWISKKYSDFIVRIGKLQQLLISCIEEDPNQLKQNFGHGFYAQATKDQVQLLSTLRSNERYFTEVYEALKMSRDSVVVSNLLRVIYFYSKHCQFLSFIQIKREDKDIRFVCRCQFTESLCLYCLAQRLTLECFGRIINPQTILWLLKILSKKSKDYENRSICCLCSLTLLSIVDHNDIACDYHEQAIIFLFNDVLQNIDVFAETSIQQSQMQRIGGNSSDNNTVDDFNRMNFGQIPDFKPRISVAQTLQKPISDNGLADTSSLISSSLRSYSSGQQQSSSEELDLDITGGDALPLPDASSSSSNPYFQHRKSRRVHLEIEKASAGSESLNRSFGLDVPKKLNFEKVEKEDLMQSKISEQNESVEGDAHGTPVKGMSGLEHTFDNRPGLKAKKSDSSMEVLSDDEDDSWEKRQEQRSSQLDSDLSKPGRPRFKKRSGSLKDFLIKGGDKLKGGLDVLNKKPRTRQAQARLGTDTSKKSRGEGESPPFRKSIEKSASFRVEQKMQTPVGLSSQVSSFHPNSNKNQSSPRRGVKRTQTSDFRKQIFQRAATSNAGSNRRKQEHTHDTLESFSSAAEEEINNTSEIMERIFKEHEGKSDTSVLDEQKNIDLYLRDSLIKAFMIIFTNEQSQHLLLNIDLIDICFSCLQNGTDITLEAQRNVARLTSMIFQFPKVQKKVLCENNQDVIIGLASLIEGILKSEKKFKQFLDQMIDLNGSKVGPSDLKKYQMKVKTLKYLLEACNIISLNKKLSQVGSLSTQVLQAMMNLMKSRNILLYLTHHDIFNLVDTINNILKQHEKNSKYFFENSGCINVITLLAEGLHDFLNRAFGHHRTDPQKKELAKLIDIYFLRDSAPVEAKIAGLADGQEEDPKERQTMEIYNTVVSVMLYQTRQQQIAHSLIIKPNLQSVFLKFIKSTFSLTEKWYSVDSEAEHHQMREDGPFDSFQMEMRSNNYRIIGKIIMEASLTDQQDRVERFLVGDCQLLDHLLGDLSVISSRITDLHLIDEMQDINPNEKDSLYHPNSSVCISTARNLSVSKPSSVHQQSIASQLQTIDEGIGCLLSEKHRGELLQFNEDLFSGIVECLKNVPFSSRMTQLILDKELASGKLLRFIENIDNHEMRLSMVYILSQILVQITQQDKNQAILSFLKFKQVPIEVIAREGNNQRTVDKLYEIARLVEKLYDLSDRIDQGEQEVAADDSTDSLTEKSNKSNKSELSSGSFKKGSKKSSKVEEGESMKESVIDLARCLKIAPFLERGKMVQEFAEIS